MCCPADGLVVCLFGQASFWSEQGLLVCSARFARRAVGGSGDAAAGPYYNPALASSCTELWSAGGSRLQHFIPLLLSLHTLGLFPTVFCFEQSMTSPFGLCSLFILDGLDFGLCLCQQASSLISKGG